MAKFRDRTSGAVIEFTNQYDIDSMKGHPDYDQLDEEGHIVAPVVDEHKTLPLQAPKRGRPTKAK